MNDNNNKIENKEIGYIIPGSNNSLSFTNRLGINKYKIEKLFNNTNDGNCIILIIQLNGKVLEEQLEILHLIDILKE